MSSINIREIAEQLGEPVERIAKTIELCGFGRARNVNTGEILVTPAVAARIVSIYENTREQTPVRPTPDNLREEFDQSEREFITYAYGRPDIPL